MSTHGSGIVDPVCPIEWTHPVNQGLVSCWMVLPNSGWRGGLTLRDTVRGGRLANDGLLTNDPIWKGPQGRPGGFGSLSFDGINDWVNVPHSGTLDLTGDMTVSLWALVRTASQTSVLVEKGTSVSSNITWGVGLQGGIWRWLHRNQYTATSNITAVVGAWTHICGVRTVSDTSVTWYVNGLLVGSTSYGEIVPVTNSVAAAIGDEGGGSHPSLPFDGSLDVVRIHNRILSATDIRTIVAQDLLGSPDLCRWVVNRVWFLAPSGIQFDSVSNSGYQAASASYSWAHTCSGNSRYLVVGVSMLSISQTVTSITYNDIGLVLLGVRSSITGDCRVEMWGLVAPAAGTNTIAVTLSGSIASAAAAVSFSGVHQTASVEGFASAQATNGIGAADATVNVVTVANGDWVVDVVATDDTSITVGAGQTERSNITGVGGSGGLSTEPKADAGTVTMSWTNVSALATWAIASVALRPTEAAGVGRILRASSLEGLGGFGQMAVNPSLGV